MAENKSTKNDFSKQEITNQDLSIQKETNQAESQKDSNLVSAQIQSSPRKTHRVPIQSSIAQAQVLAQKTQTRK